MSGAPAISPRTLPRLLEGFGVPAPDVEITGIALDSRRVTPGDLFLACSGTGTHGLAHLEQALELGAVAVAWEPTSGWARPDIEVPDVAVPMLAARASIIASRFYGEPTQPMFCAGVTGTDGKTSTAYLLAQALDAMLLPCAYVGTLGVGRIGHFARATHTTPDAVSLQAELAQLRGTGARACALEVSSHALHQDRVSGVAFDCAMLTNITRDHLDYHGTVEAYAAAKRRLFTREGLSFVVLNRDDEYGRLWATELAAPVVRYGLGEDSAAIPGQRYLAAAELQLGIDGLRFRLNSSWGDAEVHSRLLGRFNVYNVLAVMAVLLARGCALGDVVPAIAGLRTVPGRIEGFRGAKAAPLVVIDYAHTPEALQQILAAVRAHTRGKLICVFGCGGDRDRGKRPLMGAAAVTGADRVILTDDNPRNESPQKIVAEILAGCGDVVPDVVHDRAEAIRDAVSAAGPEDVVLVAGKGHEDTQTYGSDVRAFSDRAFVASLLGAELPA